MGSRRTVGVGAVVLASLGLIALGCSGSSSGGFVGGTAAPVASGTAPVASGGSTTTPPGRTPIVPAPAATQGVVRVLTYNVAGLPQGLSGSNPATNTVLISPKLNTYDLVLAQEDFWYHADLARDATHPFQTPTHTGYLSLVGDGLNRFSDTPFTGHQRIKWNVCHGLFNNGTDCLASKGFTFARHTIAPGVEIDVYNLHADAGSDQGDIDARISQFAQLATFVNAHSAGNAVICAGDTNLKGTRRPRDEQTLLDFMGATGLSDSARTLGAPEDIDRVLYRSSSTITLTPLLWREANEFVDANGNDLSDHEANNVDIEWRR